MRVERADVKLRQDTKFLRTKSLTVELVVENPEDEKQVGLLLLALHQKRQGIQFLLKP